VTLGINLSGSLALGFLLKLAVDRGWSDQVVIPVSVGFLGAFTTFSTFSQETFTLARTDRVADAALYVTVSVGGGLIAAALGYAIAAATT
jgi:CrcB protein